MTNLPKCTKEGEEIKCPNCGIEIISRLKTYKDNRFKPYIQWQNLHDTNSHLNPEGKCRGLETEPREGQSSKSETLEEAQETPKPTVPSLLDAVKKASISTKATLLWQIRLQVESTVKNLEVSPNGGMIWEMTKIIYYDLYGGSKN